MSLFSVDLAVWRDPAGRVSALKIAVLAALLWPGVDLAVRYFGHDLGPRPITQLIHGTGDWTVRFLLASLAVTPLRAVLTWPRVVVLRRMLGVGAAGYAVAHLLLFCIDQKWNLWAVAGEIVLRVYLVIGFVALVGMLVLAVTSTDGWQRRLRQRWKRLHRLVFPIGVLALLHYFMQSKADVTAAVFAAGVFFWLIGWRLAPKRFQGGLWLVAGLALLAPVMTAGVEGLWYAVATGVRASRVLAANLDFAAMRPSLQVLIAAAVVLLLAAGRRVSGFVTGAGPAGRAGRRPAN
jgi:sulfoxide reductase heme-binding subunit YedZ